MGSNLSRDDVLELLEDAGRPLHGREVLSRLGLHQRAYERVLDLLEALAQERAVQQLSGHRFKFVPVEPVKTVPKDSANAWEGALSVNPKGFGFVVAAGREDVFVPPQALSGGMHGDRVRIEVVNRTSRGTEGRIADILTRRIKRIAGVLRRRGKSTWLEPDDTRVRGPVVIPERPGEGKDGDAAVVEVTRYPDYPDETPEGRLVQVLGDPGDPNTEVAKILIREQVTEEHPEAVMAEAHHMAETIKPGKVAGRVDLRDIPLPTIDPKDARDHDDAVWVERSEKGYRVWIAIADVSEYVRTGSELDKEALERGCTIYLPDRAIPMLPQILAADLCSLKPGVERLCLCVRAHLDFEGAVMEMDVVEGVMNSAAKLTYDGVARTLGFVKETQADPEAEEYKRSLAVIAELSRILRGRRMRRGALDLNLPEPHVHVDEESGKPTEVAARAVDPGMRKAYSMIEELMLLANELVARWLIKQKSPAIYRVHGQPDEMKLERLAVMAETLGLKVDVDTLLDPVGLNDWLNSVREHPKYTVLQMLLLRSLKQATYDIQNIGHFGLASEAYLHFTSPIRRYPDLNVHRLVKAILRGKPIDASDQEIERLRTAATSASVRERAAMDVEREVVDLYRCLFMQQHIGDVFEGNVTAIVGSGIFVALKDPFVDVMVKFEMMGPDRYEISDDELSVSGSASGDRISLGDEVTVIIQDVALLRRQILGKRIPPDGVLHRMAARTFGVRPRGRVAAGKGAMRNPAARSEGGPRRRALEEMTAPAQRGRGAKSFKPGRSPKAGGSKKGIKKRR